MLVASISSFFSLRLLVNNYILLRQALGGMVSHGRRYVCCVDGSHYIQPYTRLMTNDTLVSVGKRVLCNLLRKYLGDTGLGDLGALRYQQEDVGVEN